MADGTTIGKAYVQIVPSAKGFSQSISQQLGGGQLSGVGSKAGDSIGQSTGTSFVGKLKGIIAAAGIGTVLIKGIKAALDEGARYQQSVGGIETLFGAGGAKNVQQYAKSVGKSVGEVKGKFSELQKAQNIAMKNASQSYKTAGLSASEYMDTITSFAAALKSSCKDEVEAAKVGNMAVTDMSDNANKMGTDMKSIQDAYQGFAKQNYTMLDNLKLGYGGNKTEMQRLLKDASKLSGQKYDISNLKDVYNAIHVIQTNLGITGTTAKEAASTMSGSFDMFKASLKDLGAQLATGGDVGGAIKNLISSTGTMLKNAIPMIWNIIKGIPTGIVQLIQENGSQILSAIQTKFSEIGTWISTNLPVIFRKINAGFGPALQAGVSLLEKVGEGLRNGLSQLLHKLPSISGGIVSGISKLIATNGPKMIKAGFELINHLIKGIGKAVPEILKTIPKVINNMTHKFLETDWNAVGKRIMKEIRTGIDNIGKNFPETMKKIGKAAAEGFKNIDWKAVGKTVLTILKLALEAGGTLLLGIGKLLGKAVLLGLKLAWRAVKTIGSNLVKGLWNGIKDMAGWIKSKIQGFGKGVLNSLKSFFGIHSPSKVMRDQIGVMIGRGVAAGITASTKNAKKSAEAQGKAVLAVYKKNLADYKKTHDMGLKDEARYWKGIRSHVKKGTGVYKEVNTLYQAALKTQSKNSLSEYKKRLSDYKKTHDTTLAYDVKYWKRRLDNAKKGTSLYKQINVQYEAARKKVRDNLKKNLASARKDYTSSAKEIIKNYQSTVKELQSSYNSLVSERKESIVSAFDPFSEWHANESTMDGGHLLLNLKNFRIAQAQWSSAMTELKSRVGDGKLYDYMSSLGPKALTQVQDLLSLNDDQLKQYADMYHQMRADAGTEAQAELTSELADTNKKIETARQKADQELDKLTTKFKKTVKGFGGTIKSVTPDIKKQASSLGNAFINSYEWSLKQGMPKIYAVYKSLVNASNTAAKAVQQAVSNNSTSTTNNTFNISGVTDPIKLAATVSRKIAKDSSRKKAATGKRTTTAKKKVAGR